MKKVLALALFPAVMFLSAAFSQDIGTWTAIAPLNKARGGNCIAYSATTGKFYVLGGRDNPSGGTTNIPIEEYDVASNTWTNKINLSVGVSSAGAAAVGSYFYIAGGLDNASAPSAELQRFDPAANVVTTLAAMPAPNNSHAVVAIGNKIYVLGGSATSGIAGTTNYCYDIAANTWSSGAAAPTAVRRVGGATDGTYIYLIGGTDTVGNALDVVQRYNPETNSWNIIAPLTTARSGPSAFFDGTRIWAVNGEAAAFLTSTEYYIDGAWTAGPDTINAARSEGAAYSAEKQLAIKAGGLAGGPAVTDKAEKLSITQPTPLVTLTLNKTSLNPGDAFTVDLTVQPISQAFDAWGVIAGPGSIMYSFVLGKPNDIYTGGKAMVTRVAGLASTYTGRILSTTIPAGVAGNYTVIFELVPAGTPPIMPINAYESQKAITVH